MSLIEHYIIFYLLRYVDINQNMSFLSFGRTRFCPMYELLNSNGNEINFF